MKRYELEGEAQSEQRKGARAKQMRRRVQKCDSESEKDRVHKCAKEQTKQHARNSYSYRLRGEQPEHVDKN